MEVFNQNFLSGLDSDIHIRACLHINVIELPVLRGNALWGKRLSSPQFLVHNWSGACQSPGTHTRGFSWRKGWEIVGHVAGAIDLASGAQREWAELAERLSCEQ